MWQQNISKLMYSSGWGSGFRLPIANAENLELERELEKRHRLIQIKQAELDDIDKHTTILEKALRNTSDHVAHDAKLTNAKTSEMAAEKELLKIAEKDASHLSRECKEAQQAFEKVAKKNRDLVAEIRARKSDLAELTELIEYDRKELAVIEKRASDESRILEDIEELCDLDEDALKKYEARYKKATADAGTLRLELDAKVSLTRIMQSELDGVSEHFRKLHRERGEIVSMWKDTMTALTQRDTEMNMIAEMYQETDSLVKTATEKVAEERRKLQIQTQSGSGALMQLNKWDRKVMDLREEMSSVSEYSQSLKDNILSYEIGISLASTQTKELMSKSTSIDTELSEMNSRVTAAANQIAELQKKAKESSSSMLTAGERMTQIQALIDEEEKKLECFRKTLEREMGRKGQWLNKKGALVGRDTNLDLEIRGANAGLHRLTAKNKDAVMKLEKSKSEIYCAELDLISMQLRYKPLVEPKITDTKQDYEEGARHGALKMELVDIKKKKGFVFSQVNHLVNINKKIYREKMNLDKEMVRLDSRNNEHRSAVRGFVKNLELMVGEFQTAIVDNSLIKLKLKQLTKIQQQEKNMLSSSGQKRAILESAIKEKRSEIDAHSRILEMRKRIVKDDLSQMKIQLGYLSACIMKRRDRYAIIMKLMANRDDVGGEADDIKSEAYYVLKMVQEREILQQEGDNWDRKVKEAEIETEALQNSLALIKCSNDQFKDSLKPVADDACMAEINRLKKLEKECLTRKNRAVNTLRKLREEIPIKIETIEVIQHQTSSEANKAMDREYDLRMLSGDLRNQAQSGKRVRMLTNKLLRSIAFSGPEEKELVSRDVKLKATRRKFEFAIQSLAKLLNVHPSMYDMIGKSLSRQFGEQTSLQFLNRSSPWIGDCSSPTGSTTGGGTVRKGSAGRKCTSITRGGSIVEHDHPVKSSKSVESVKFGTTSSAPLNQGQSASKSITGLLKHSIASSVGPSVSTLLAPRSAGIHDGMKVPMRTESEMEMLQNVAKAVESNRQLIVEERKKKKAIQKNLELLQKKGLKKGESATDAESIFFNPMQDSNQRFVPETSFPKLPLSRDKKERQDDGLASGSSAGDLIQPLDLGDDDQKQDQEMKSPQDKEKSPERLDSISESPELGESKEDA